MTVAGILSSYSLVPAYIFNRPPFPANGFSCISWKLLLISSLLCAKCNCECHDRFSLMMLKLCRFVELKKFYGIEDARPVAGASGPQKMASGLLCKNRSVFPIIYYEYFRIHLRIAKTMQQLLWNAWGLPLGRSSRWQKSCQLQLRCVPKLVCGLKLMGNSLTEKMS